MTSFSEDDIIIFSCCAGAIYLYRDLVKMFVNEGVGNRRVATCIYVSTQFKYFGNKILCLLYFDITWTFLEQKFLFLEVLNWVETYIATR
jgi:hypothetical protein